MRYLGNGAESFDAVSFWPTGCATPTFLDQNLKNSRHDLMPPPVGTLLRLRSGPQPSGDCATDPTWRSHCSLWTQTYARAPLEITLQPSAAARGRGGHIGGRMLQEEVPDGARGGLAVTPETLSLPKLGCPIVG